MEETSNIPDGQIIYREEEDKFYKFTEKGGWVEKPPNIGDFKRTENGMLIYGPKGWFEFKDPQTLVLKALTKSYEKIFLADNNLNLKELESNILTAIDIVKGLDFVKGRFG